MKNQFPGEIRIDNKNIKRYIYIYVTNKQINLYLNDFFSLISLEFDLKDFNNSGDSHSVKLQTGTIFLETYLKIPFDILMHSF